MLGTGVSQAFYYLVLDGAGILSIGIVPEILVVVESPVLGGCTLFRYLHAAGLRQSHIIVERGANCITLLHSNCD